MPSLLDARCTRLRLPSIVVAMIGASALALAWSPDEVKSARAIPAHIAGTFGNPLAYQELADGSAYVFDRRQHTVYRIDAARTKAEPILLLGQEPGRILQPSAFDSVPDGTFVVADAPARTERIQTFFGQTLIGSFTLPGRSMPRLVIDDIVLNGIGSLSLTAGITILVNQPETRTLISEYDLHGVSKRAFGSLRATGHEHDEAIHLAFNSGIPLKVPGGGFYFVFHSGVPLFQRYDEMGRLQFERRIQGRELDDTLAKQATTWPRRKVGDDLIPIVPPVVRAARVDPDGRLWVSLVVPVTYVYDTDGDKIRTVRFRAAGVLTPNSLFFVPGGGRSRLLVTPGLFEFEVGK